MDGNAGDDTLHAVFGDEGPETLRGIRDLEGPIHQEPQNMIIQVVLSAMLAGLALYAYSQRARSRVVAWTMLSACVFGEVMVLAPNLANDIAHLAGVGRGA